jgi:hypothetical protein
MPCEMASVMTVYICGTAVGRVKDFGPGRVLAHARKPDGTFVCLGFFVDRRAAREAVENGPSPSSGDAA